VIVPFVIPHVQVAPACASTLATCPVEAAPTTDGAANTGAVGLGITTTGVLPVPGTQPSTATVTS
jgi:hypothetical protein